MFHNEITNSYFEYGFLYYTNLNIPYGSHQIRNTTFANNRSKVGTFLYIDDFGEKRTILLINLYDNRFINNTASIYGGILYSNAREKINLSDYVKIHNSTYINNSAPFGIFLFLE